MQSSKPNPSLTGASMVTTPQTKFNTNAKLAKFKYWAQIGWFQVSDSLRWIALL
jgi:hypothetical protein